jgi:hypothetical protein
MTAGWQFSTRIAPFPPPFRIVYHLAGRIDFKLLAERK